MKSIIKESYYGNVGNGELMNVMKNFDKLAGAVCEADDKLRATLNEEQLALYEKFIDAVETRNADEVANHYTVGFKLGLMTGIEAATTEDDWK